MAITVYPSCQPQGKCQYIEPRSGGGAVIYLMTDNDTGFFPLWELQLFFVGYSIILHMDLSFLLPCLWFT